MPENTSKLTISWETIHQHACELAHKIPSNKNYDGIVAIARGGLIPAAIIATELNIRLIETYCLSSYIEKNQSDIIIHKAPQITPSGNNWLFIDDLVDSGKTAQYLKQEHPDSHLATLYAKPAGKAWVDTYIMDVAQSTWIEFPWEKSFSPRGS